MGNILVAQSGGPTVAINASLAGVIEGGLANGCGKIYGSINGITGIINDKVLDLTSVVENDRHFLKRLKVTPAMYLGSCRFKLPDADSGDGVYETLFSQFKKYDIKAFFYIGGNDSMDTVAKLSAYAASIGSDIKFMGVPKTVDNDLCITDHTPGFGSAAKYISTSTMEIIYDAKIYDVKSVTIIEVMGRDAGWLTAATALAKNDYCDGPDLIYLPETAFEKDQFLNDLRQLLEQKSNVVVAVSEGIHDKDGNYISATSAAADNFGHAQLSGAGKALEYLVKDELGVKVRSIEVNVLQRAAAHHASLVDLNESVQIGRAAVDFAMAGTTGSMAVINRVNNNPYTVEYAFAPITGIANEAKSVPREWINPAGNGVTKELIDYLKPLIIGLPNVEYKDGLPVYVSR